MRAFRKEVFIGISVEAKLKDEVAAEKSGEREVALFFEVNPQQSVKEEHNENDAVVESKGYIFPRYMVCESFFCINSKRELKR